MSEHHRELMEFVLEQAESQPVKKRARIYRSLAILCGDERQAPELNRMASALEAAESNCREFRFKYQSV